MYARSNSLKVRTRDKGWKENDFDEARTILLRASHPLKNSRLASRKIVLYDLPSSRRQFLRFFVRLCQTSKKRERRVVKTKKKLRKRGTKSSGKRDEGGSERRDGGGVRCPRSFEPSPSGENRHGGGSSSKWRRTDFPSSRTRDLSPVRSTPPSPPRQHETRWNKPTNERHHDSA